MPALHNEGDVSRNYVSYNFQTLRDDVFMLARDGDVTGNRISPARSSCAIHVGSYNANRESIYVQQQTISAEGLSGIAFSTNVPHTVRGGPTRVKDGPTTGGRSRPRPTCRAATRPSSAPTATSRSNDDNNAIMAQLLMQGTNYVELHRPLLLGRRGRARPARRSSSPSATSRRRSSAATLHQLAFPDDFRKHVEHGGELEHAHEHPGRDIGEAVRCTRPQARDPRRPGPRRVPLRRLRRGRPARLRHRVHRPQGLLRADHHRAGLAAGPAVLRPDQVRHRRRRADARPPPTRRAPTAPRTASRRSTRCTATSTSPTARRA